MKHKLKTLLFLMTIVCFNNSCTEDAKFELRDYPYVITDENVDIDTIGVTLKAKIFYSDKSQITDYGFLLTRMSYLSGFYPKTKKYSLIKDGVSEEFSLRLTHEMDKELLKESVYTYEAYVEGADFKVKGDVVEFHTKGTKTFYIEDYFPKQGADGTEVKLYGDFNSLGHLKEIYVNGMPMSVTESSSELIVFDILPNPFIGNVEILLKGPAGSGSASVPFELIGPEVTSFSSSGQSGELIVIEGNNLMSNGGEVSVYFDDSKAEIIDASSNSLTLAIPSNRNFLFDDRTSSVKLINGKKEIVAKDKFVINKSWSVKTGERAFDWGWEYNAFVYQNEGYVYEYNTLNMYKYSPSSDKWSFIPSTNSPDLRNDGSLFVVSGNKVYKVGGKSVHDGPIKVVWSFSFDDNTWRQEEDLPFYFENKASNFELNGNVYVLTDLGELWICNFEKKQYEKKNSFSMSFANNLIYTFISDNTAYAVTSGSTWRYDEQKDEWSVVASNQFFDGDYTEAPIGFAYNDTGYVIDGGTDLYKYNTTNNRWILTSFYPGPSGGNTYKTVFVANNVAYVVATSSHSVGASSRMYGYEEKK